MSFEEKKQTIKSLLVLTILTLLMACARESNTTLHSPDKQGVSSGGGGYFNIHSKKLLEDAQEHLTAMILNSSPHVLEALPTDFGKDKFVSMIKNIRILDKESKKRKTDLMFDYFCEDIDGSRHYRMTKKVSKNGKSYFNCNSGQPRIAALKLFFTVYADKDKKTIDTRDYNAYVRSVEDRIIHEISHFIVAQTDKDEAFNEVFATNFVKALDYDLVHCKWSNDGLPSEYLEEASFHNEELVFSRSNPMLVNTYNTDSYDKFYWALWYLDSNYRQGKIPYTMNDKSYNSYQIKQTSHSSYLIELVSDTNDNIEVLLETPHHRPMQKKFEAIFSLKLKTGEEFKSEANCEGYYSALDYEYPPSN